MDTLKTALSNVIVQYILKVGGGLLAGWGISTGSVTEIVMAIVGIILGAIGHYLQVDKALYTPPPTN